MSLADQRKAFDQWSAAAIAANGGVETSAVRLARTILELREAAAGAGSGIEAGMKRGGAAVDAVAVRVNSLGERLNQLAGSLSAVENGIRSAGGQANKLAADGGTNLSTSRPNDFTPVDNTGLSSLQAKRQTGTLTAADLATATAVFNAAKANLTQAQSSATQYSAGGFASAQSDYNAARTLLDLITSLARKEPGSSTTTAKASTATRNVEVTLNVGGQSVVMGATSSAADAFVRALEAAKRVAS